MSLQPYSDEELNYFKFASFVLKEFPDALRSIFVDMWDTRVAPSSTVWDDSSLVRNILHNNEAPNTKIPTNNSFKEWDCTALFQATLYARTYALPDSTGKKKTLGEMYLKGRKPASAPFHSAVSSSSGDANETIALAVDQLRLLRNTLCHTSSPEINKVTFDDYVKHAKDAFTALNFSTASLERIGNLKESDFPTKEVEKLKENISRQRNDFHLFLESKVIDEMSEMKDGMSGMKDEMSGMKDGMKDEMSGMKDGMSGMKDGMSEMKDGMSGMKDGMSGMKDGMKDEMSGMKYGMSGMKDGMSGIKDGMSGMKDEMSEMKDGMSGMKDGMSGMKDGMKDGMSGMKDIMSGMKDGMSGMKDGMSGMKDGMSGMKDGMSGIKDVMSGMKDGMKDGMSEVKDGMSEMNEKLNSIEGILTQAKGTTGMLFMYNYVLTIDFPIRKLRLYHMINTFIVQFPQPLFFSLILLTKLIYPAPVGITQCIF
jgi:type VI secretion system secreted protein VgrG